MTVRPEKLGDRAAVRRVHEAAFGRPDEADIVDRLRDRAARYLALVATESGVVVGHVAFSPVTLDPPQTLLTAFGLAPMAVIPDRQRGGVGTALVQAGIAACRDAGADAVFVLGHPDYYPRFGFEPTAPLGIRDAYGAPPEAFMVLELTPGSLGTVRGAVHYHPALDG